MRKNKFSVNLITGESIGKKKSKFSTRWHFIFCIVALFIGNLYSLKLLQQTTNITIFIFSIIYLSILILFIIAIYAQDIYFYFKIRKFRKWQEWRERMMGGL